MKETMVAHKPEIWSYLTLDPMKHVVHLKALTTYSQHIQSHYFSNGPLSGVLFVYPTEVTTFESEVYPDAEYVVLITTDGPTITEQMIDYLPSQNNLLFKFTNPVDRIVIESKFLLKRINTYLSYSCDPLLEFARSPYVHVSQKYEPHLLPLFEGTGYDASTIKNLFEIAHAFSFSIEENGEPLAVALAYQNHEAIWEIGMLFTVEKARRKGYAKQLVESALGQVLAKGFLPRYQMHENNYASIALAEEVGLTLFLTTEHCLYRHH